MLAHKICFFIHFYGSRKEIFVSFLIFLFSDLWPASQLSAEACPNTLMPKTLKLFQLYPNITEPCQTMLIQSWSIIQENKACESLLLGLCIQKMDNALNYARLNFPNSFSKGKRNYTISWYLRFFLFLAISYTRPCLNELHKEYCMKRKLQALDWNEWPRYLGGKWTVMSIALQSCVILKEKKKTF